MIYNSKKVVIFLTIIYFIKIGQPLTIHHNGDPIANLGHDVSNLDWVISNNEYIFPEIKVVYTIGYHPKYMLMYL